VERLNKETPKVKDKDKDKFEPPNEDSGGPARTSEFQPTIKPFAATREVIDETNRGQDITREKRAVWMVHGMGQQISCETLGMLANGVMDALPDQRIKPHTVWRALRSQIAPGSIAPDAGLAKLL
jgi:hypothetical protein